MALDQPIVGEQDLLVEFLDPRVMELTATSPVANGCKTCNGGSGFGQCNICAGSKSNMMNSNHFNRLAQSELVAEEITQLDSREFDPLTLPTGPGEDADAFFRFDDDPEYLYTHQPEILISESGSPSDTVMTRAASTASLSTGFPHRNTIDYDSLAHLSCTLPLSILDEHEETRKELARIKFGNPKMNPCPITVNVTHPSVIDFLSEAMSNMQYQLEVLDLPLHSRVETQIKLKFKFSPAPKELLLHVPQDLISKPKFCMANSVKSLPDMLKKKMLFMDSYVMTSDLLQSCVVCSRCIKREQKRALRLKVSDVHNDDVEALGAKSTDGLTGASQMVNPWENDKMLKKAIIYNCKEIVSFQPPSGLPTDQSKVLNFSARIICYCRHHKEAEGFKLLVVVRDWEGNVRGKCVSGPIMIMDRKKTPSSVTRSAMGLNGARKSSHLGNVSIPGTYDDIPLDQSDLASLHPLSPNLIDDSTSDSAARGLKRKKISYDDLYNSTGFLPVSNSDTNISVHTASNSLGDGLYPKGGKGHVSYLQMGSNLLAAMPTSRTPTNHLQNPKHVGVISVTGMPPDDNTPCILKIIPAQGPCRGGIEVTLLGYNFRPGLLIKFGAKTALATHCWSESTIVTYLPPCAHPGQVLVSFENEATPQSLTPGLHMIFTYTDDTDRQLIELALQIVGLKMNGKLEDAKNIARRIVGTDVEKKPKVEEKTENSNGSSSEYLSINRNSEENSLTAKAQEEALWYDSAHRAVENLTRSNLSTQEILINFLSLVDLPNCPIIIPNWNLANTHGQTLLHLASLKNYTKLIGFLIGHGTKIDIQDDQGLTPFFMALVCGHRSLMEMLLAYRPNWNLKLDNDKHVLDYCDLNVLDVFERLARATSPPQNGLENEGKTSGGVDTVSGNGAHDQASFAHLRRPSDEPLNRSISLDSLNSININSYGRHVSRMITESVREERCETMEKAASSANGIQEESFPFISPACSPSAFGNDSDFADSELDSDDDIYESDYEDYDYDEEVDSDEEVGRELGTRYNFSFAEMSRIGSSATEITASADQQDTNRLDESEHAARSGLWSKMKRAVFSLAPDDTTNLPLYDDLFPFGSSGEMRPKLGLERVLNQGLQVTLLLSNDMIILRKGDEDAGIVSDSLEDLALSYINRPRKTVRNDKMLLFFWIPVLFLITSIFMYVSITGYKVQMIEQFKEKARNTLGNVMVGNERLARVFRKNQVTP